MQERALARFEKKISLKLRERISNEEMLESAMLDDAESKELTDTAPLAHVLQVRRRRRSAFLRTHRRTTQLFGNLVFLLQTEPRYLSAMMQSVGGALAPICDERQFDRLRARAGAGAGAGQARWRGGQHALCEPVRCARGAPPPGPHSGTAGERAAGRRALKRLIGGQDGLVERFRDCTDITTYLRETSYVTKLITAYSRREPCLAVRRPCGGSARLALTQPGRAGAARHAAGSAQGAA